MSIFKGHLNQSHKLSRVWKCDRETDHAMGNCAAIGGVACATREISPNNVYNASEFCN